MRLIVASLVGGALLALMGCTGGTLVLDAGPSSTASPSGSSSDAPSPSVETAADVALVTAENRRLARAASRAALASMPLPEGATRLKGEPAGWPPVGMSLGPSDGRLSARGWWSVPASHAVVERYLTNHAPQGMRHLGKSPIHDGATRSIEYVSVRPQNPAAFTGPTLLVEIFQIGDDTVLKATTFLAARVGVSAQHRILDDVTAVRIERIGRGQSDRPNRKNHRLPTVELSAASDPRDVERLVDAFNGLYGSQSAGGGSCPFPGVPQPQTTITFTTKSAEGVTGTVVADWYPSCFGQITVTVDGDELEGTLDPGSWTRLVYNMAKAG